MAWPAGRKSNYESVDETAVGVSARTTSLILLFVAKLVANSPNG
jgi:hypothetical protein